MLRGDPLARVLRVDLTRKRFWVEERPELFERWLGGAGVAIRLLEELCPPGCDPLGPDNPVVLAVGPLVGLFPMASKTVAMFKSPHTGNLGESHCGGRSAVAIRLAGYGAIVIQGASRRPVYLSVHGDRVAFRDASALWGMGSTLTVGRILREREPAPGLRTIMRIGRAGERMVSFASVTTETYRHFGRLGLGAVFGSKRLKAIVVSGQGALPVVDRRAYRELYREVYREATSPAMRKYHDLGTAENVLRLNAMGALPTRNLSAARFEAAEAISGEAMARGYLGRRLACSHCPVACVHIAALREPYEDEPFFYKTSMISYDYEPLYALGSMLGVADPEGCLRLMETTEALGIDAMSAGPLLAWATEAQQRGLISAEQAGGLRLEWGDWRAYREALRRIVEAEGEVWRDLARGLERAAARHGGQEFALSLGGNEMPGYHTGPAALVGFLVGSRHSHLDGAGYQLDERALGEGRTLSPAEVAEGLLAEERWRQVLASLVVCFFARGIYRPELVRRALAVVGLERSEEELERLGAEVHARKYAFKRREGFRPEGLRLPRRLLETPSALGELREEFIREAVDRFRGAVEALLRAKRGGEARDGIG